MSQMPAAEKQQSETPQVPTRKFGKTGPDVSALSLGAIQLVDNQVILTSSLKWGVTYWDTAYGYTNGNSEICIGKFLAARPEMRKKVFIATKASHAKGAQEVEGTSSGVAQKNEYRLRRCFLRRSRFE